MRERTSIVVHLLATALLTCAAAPAARSQIFELPRADSTIGDFFGTAVAISGSRVLVGATGEDVCGDNSGAAYIYERRGIDWEQAALLTPSDCEPGRFFGRSVALADDIAVVSATQEFFSQEAPNSVYVFEPDSVGTWRETARLTGGSSSDEGPFATAVSVHGGRILVTASGNPSGGPRGGAAYVFERTPNGTWAQSQRFTVPSTRFGIFGTSGAIHGDRAIVSASTYFRYQPGSVYFFAYDAPSDKWVMVARHGGIDDFFISVDLDERRAVVGESKAGRSDTGAASIFEADSTGAWMSDDTIRPGNPYSHGAFGTDVAIAGDYALIAAYDEQLGLDFNVHRVVYVFKRSADGLWRQHQVIDVGEATFGAALDLDGDYAVIGSAGDAEPGAAYIVRLAD